MPRERKERGGKESWKTRGKRGFTGCVVRNHGEYCMNSQPRFSDLFSYINLVEHGLIIPAVGYRRCIQSEHTMSSRDSKELLGSPQAIAGSSRLPATNHEQESASRSTECEVTHKLAIDSRRNSGRHIHNFIFCAAQCKKARSQIPISIQHKICERNCTEDELFHFFRLTGQRRSKLSSQNDAASGAASRNQSALAPVVFTCGGE